MHCWKRAVATLAAMPAVFAGPLLADNAPTFSVDFQGGVIGMPDAFNGVPITEGDILLAPSFLPEPGNPPPPGLFLAGGPPFHPDLGLMPAPPGVMPGVPSRLEVDALSYGLDHFLEDQPTRPEMLLFSVDEFASGFPTSNTPEVFSEGVFGTTEASADVFMTFPPDPFHMLPVPPGAVIFGNTQLFDGDGLAPPPAILPPLPASPFPHGLGLIEPNLPTVGLLPDGGDNLDALDIDTRLALPPFPVFPVYFSLDATFIDPLEPVGANSGSAVAHGFVGGDVLVSTAPGGPPVLYAAANDLGLDLAGGPGSDDLDALILLENGTGVFEPSVMPFPPRDWGPGMPADMLMFSVRRESAVVGMPDSIFGEPITEGDVLVPPLPGGASPYPGIFIPAESLGLVTSPTRGSPAGLFPLPDDLNALDLAPDCNGNAVPDALDVTYGLSDDCQGNAVPDECETDTDGDGLIDGCDFDDDNDGVDDASDPAPLDPDVCGDFDADTCDDCSIGTDDFGPEPDGDTGNDGPDADADGLCDAGDPDDDNDGVSDADDPAPLDPDVCGDSDADTCDDCSVGTDDFGPQNDSLPGNDGPDTDGDGACDAGDADDDNDGVTDGSDPDPLNPDVCGDSDADTCDDCTVGTDDFGPQTDSLPGNDGPDTDGDGACDAGDADDDNDGVGDGSDPDPANPDICGDAEGDGCDDCTVGTDDFGPAPDNEPFNDGVDTDGDGACDSGDVDDDNDGIADGNDPAPLDPDVCGDADGDTCDDCSIGTDDFGQLPDADPANDGPDPDGDGLCDAGDNCPNHANPAQADCDNDAVGDVCAIASGMSTDCNNNAIPDNCEACPADLNGDLVVDSADLALLLGAWGPNPGHCADLNGDGTVDSADLALLLGAWGPC